MQGRNVRFLSRVTSTRLAVYHNRTVPTRSMLELEGKECSHWPLAQPKIIASDLSGFMARILHQNQSYNNTRLWWGDRAM